MPETTFLSDDNGDDEIEMLDNVKGSIMILEMGQSKKVLRFFNTYNPVREVADANAGQFEMILGYQDGEILRHIEMPECVKKNFLTLLKFGRDGLARKIDYQRPKKTDVILDDFVCHQFAQLLCSDHTLPWQQRFDFINQMVSTEAIIDDRFCSIVPVEKKEESFQLCGSIADREKDVYVLKNPYALHTLISELHFQFFQPVSGMFHYLSIWLLNSARMKAHIVDMFS